MFSTGKIGLIYVKADWIRSIFLPYFLFKCIILNIWIDLNNFTSILAVQL